MQKTSVRISPSALFPAVLLMLTGSLSAQGPLEPESRSFDIIVDISGTNQSPNLARMQKLALGEAQGANLLTTGERAIPVYVKPDFEPGRQRAAGLMVALFSYDFLKQRGYGQTGQAITNKATADALALEFSRTYLLQGHGGLGSSGQLLCPVRGGFLRLVGFKFNPRAEVEITNLRADEATVSSPTQKAKLEAMRKAEEARVGLLLLGDQAGLEYPILPNLGPQEVERRLKAEPRLRLDPKLSIGVDSNGVYVLPLQRAGRPFGFSFEAGGSYTTTENFTANGAITLKNALGRQMFDRSGPYDTLELNGRAGPQLQNLTGKWGTPFFPPENQLQLQLSTAGGFEHNDRTAFPGPPERTLETKVWSGSVNVSATFDSFSLKEQTERLFNAPSRRRFEYLTSLAAGLAYSDTTILGQTPTPALAQGRATTINGRLGVTLIFDLYHPQQAGVGEVHFDASLSGETAPGDLSDNFDYAKWQIAAELTLWFGWRDSRDFFLRQNIRNGSLYGTAPELSLFRLGGGESVRGLQQGELAGRSVLSTSTEIGFSLSRLAQLLFPQRTNSSSGTGDALTEPPVSSPLSGMYLKTFFDWGRTSQDGSLGTPWHAGEGAVAYGAALDIAKQSIGGQQGSFSLGYAFSPQSRLHRGGVVFASVNFPF